MERKRMIPKGLIGRRDRHVSEDGYGDGRDRIGWALCRHPHRRNEDVAAGLGVEDALIALLDAEETAEAQ